MARFITAVTKPETAIVWSAYCAFALVGSAETVAALGNSHIEVGLF
jgi:hypothetical protein